MISSILPKNTRAVVQLLYLITKLAKYSILTSSYIQVIEKENSGVSVYSLKWRF